MPLFLTLCYFIHYLVLWVSVFLKLFFHSSTNFTLVSTNSLALCRAIIVMVLDIALLGWNSARYGFLFLFFFFRAGKSKNWVFCYYFTFPHKPASNENAKLVLLVVLINCYLPVRGIRRRNCGGEKESMVLDCAFRFGSFSLLRVNAFLYYGCASEKLFDYFTKRGK